jgi:hypothetical protein
MLLVLATTFGFCLLAMAKPRPPAPLVFYASQSGRPTLDQGEGGGNPFASALVELLERQSLTYTELQAGLIALTKEKSRGVQVPECPAVVESANWRLKPVPASAKRVALVVVYSAYHSARVSSLPGAERDLERVATALRGAGFDVKTIANPSRNALQANLDELSRASKSAEAALVYMTGHGFEHHGQVYLMPNDYPFAAKVSPERAVHVPSFAGYLKAKRANVVLFGGCRTYK